MVNSNSIIKDLDNIVVLSIDGPNINNLKVENILNSKYYKSKVLDISLEKNTWTHILDYRQLNYAFELLGIEDTKITETFNIGYARSESYYDRGVLGVYNSSNIEQLNNMIIFSRRFEIKKQGFEELLNSFKEKKSILTTEIKR